MADPHAGSATASPTSKKTFAFLLKEAESPFPQFNLSPSTHRGEPALKLPQSLVESLSKSFRFALIGKFLHARLSMEKARLAFAKLGVKGNYSLGHLDHKHMLIRLQYEGDFNRIGLKIYGSSMDSLGIYSDGVLISDLMWNLLWHRSGTLFLIYLCSSLKNNVFLRLGS